MRTLTRLLAPAVLAGVLALASATPLLASDAPSPADAPPAPGQEAEGGRDVLPVLIWALVGAALLSGALGTLYLLKRELGGFDPRPGAWTAPIGVMPSADLPVEEGDFPAGDGDDHGH